MTQKSILVKILAFFLFFGFGANLAYKHPKKLKVDLDVLIKKRTFKYDHLKRLRPINFASLLKDENLNIPVILT
jgi:hypothetical protein